MKICIIGNSHVAALKRAIRAHPNPLGVDILALGGRALLPNLKIDENHQLYSTHVEVANAIHESEIKVLSDYSFVVIYGCQLRAAGRGLNWFRHIRQANDRYSSAFCDELTDEFITNTDHYRFLAENSSTVSSLRDTRFISIPSPMPNELMPEFFRHALSSKAVQVCNLKIKSRLNQLGVEFLDTPSEIINTDGVATKSKYKNSREDDFSHLNHMGGELMLNKILSVLKF